MCSVAYKGFPSIGHLVSSIPAYSQSDLFQEQVESELKTIFAPEDMLPLEDTAEQDTSAHSTWGLFGAPRMMFIALIDEGFLIAGTAQCLVLGKKDRKVKEAFGKYVVDAI